MFLGIRHRARVLSHPACALLRQQRTAVVSSHNHNSSNSDGQRLRQALQAIPNSYSLRHFSSSPSLPLRCAPIRGSSSLLQPNNQRTTSNHQIRKKHDSQNSIDPELEREQREFSKLLQKLSRGSTSSLKDLGFREDEDEIVREMFDEEFLAFDREMREEQQRLQEQFGDQPEERHPHVEIDIQSALRNAEKVLLGEPGGKVHKPEYKPHKIKVTVPSEALDAFYHFEREFCVDDNQDEADIIEYPEDDQIQYMLSYPAYDVADPDLKDKVAAMERREKKEAERVRVGEPIMLMNERNAEYYMKMATVGEPIPPPKHGEKDPLEDEEDKAEIEAIIKNTVKKNTGKGDSSKKGKQSREEKGAAAEEMKDAYIDEESEFVDMNENTDDEYGDGMEDEGEYASYLLNNLNKLYAEKFMKEMAPKLEWDDAEDEDEEEEEEGKELSQYDKEQAKKELGIDVDELEADMQRNQRIFSYLEKIIQQNATNLPKELCDEASRVLRHVREKLEYDDDDDSDLVELEKLAQQIQSISAPPDARRQQKAESSEGSGNNNNNNNNGNEEDEDIDGIFNIGLTPEVLTKLVSNQLAQPSNKINNSSTGNGNGNGNNADEVAEINAELERLLGELQSAQDVSSLALRRSNLGLEDDDDEVNKHKNNNKKDNNDEDADIERITRSVLSTANVKGSDLERQLQNDPMFREFQAIQQQLSQSSSATPLLQSEDITRIMQSMDKWSLSLDELERQQDEQLKAQLKHDIQMAQEQEQQQEQQQQQQQWSFFSTIMDENDNNSNSSSSSSNNNNKRRQK